MSEGQAGRASLKRSASEDDSSDDDPNGRAVSGGHGGAAAQSRSERKRFREKKRRSDVNKGFEDLMNLLMEIDPEVRAVAEERARRGTWKGSLGGQEDSIMSRVDLIGRAVAVLRRIHQENEQRKVLINHLMLREQAGRLDDLGRGELSRSTAALSAGSLMDAGSRLASQQAVLSQLLAQSPAYASDSLLAQSSLNPLLTARQPLPQPQLSGVEQLVGLGGQFRAAGGTSYGGLGQASAGQQVPYSAEQLMTLRLLREQELLRALSRDAAGRGSSSSPPRGPFQR